MSSKNVDRLSMLPDDILSHILLLMPSECAVRTSILSKRWRYTWSLVMNLEYSYYNKNFRSLKTFLNRVLKFNITSQVNIFGLYIYSQQYKSNVEESIVYNWITEAIRLNVREFDMDFDPRRLPVSLFTCRTLKKLKLYLGPYSKWRCPYSVNLPCLKTLIICVYGNPLEIGFKLINGSPVLESLVLEVFLHDGKEDYLFYIPTLKRLELKCDDYLRSVINKVVLNVPNLEYLSVSGSLCSSFVMDNVSSLVQAKILFGKKISDNLWVELLKGLSGVKSFSYKIQLENPPTLPLPIFPNMKHMELSDTWDSGKIVQFLESCLALEHLYIGTIHQYASDGWIEPESVPVCMLTNLTTIKLPIDGTANNDYFKFLEYMLGNAKVLKTVTLTWNNLDVRQRIRLGDKVFKFRRASTYCEIDFLEVVE